MAGVDCDIQRAILDQRQHLFCLVELLQSRLQAATLAGTVGIEAHLVAQEAPLGFQDQGYVACFADFADRSEKLFLPVRVVSCWLAALSRDIGAALVSQPFYDLVEKLAAIPGCHGRDRKSTRLNSSHSCAYRMPSSA